MKKRLLITSIVMMLVVAVALSTATYAWFTSNASVTASTIKITAATSDADAIGIGWIGSEAYLGASNSISSDAAGTYQPMVPLTLAPSTTSAVTFSGATIKSVDGDLVFNDDAGARTPYTFATTGSTAFYVKNLSNANTVQNLKMTLTWNAEDTYTEVTTGLTAESTAPADTYYTLSEDTYTVVTAGTVKGEATWYTKDVKNDNLVRVGVFTRDAAVRSGTPATTDLTFKGVLAKTADANTEWGNVVAGNSVAALCADDAEVKTVTYIDLGSLVPNAQIDFVVKVWLDGVLLNDDEAGKVASFGLNFAAAAATV